MPLFSDTIDAIIILVGAVSGTIYSITTANRRVRSPQEEEMHVRLAEMKMKFKKSRERARGGISICADVGGEVSMADDARGALSKIES